MKNTDVIPLILLGHFSSLRGESLRGKRIVAAVKSLPYSLATFLLYSKAHKQPKTVPVFPGIFMKIHRSIKRKCSNPYLQYVQSFPNHLLLIFSSCFKKALQNSMCLSVSVQYLLARVGPLKKKNLAWRPERKINVWHAAFRQMLEGNERVE